MKWSPSHSKTGSHILCHYLVPRGQKSLQEEPPCLDRCILQTARSTTLQENSLFSTETWLQNRQISTKRVQQNIHGLRVTELKRSEGQSSQSVLLHNCRLFTKPCFISKCLHLCAPEWTWICMFLCFCCNMSVLRWSLKLTWHRCLQCSSWQSSSWPGSAGQQLQMLSSPGPAGTPHPGSKHQN